MNRKQVLDAAALCVTHDRNDIYGGPEDSFAIIADLWSVYWQAAGRANFEPHDVALMLGLLKVARLVRNPKHADSWVDLAGYAACGSECAHVAVDVHIEAGADLELQPDAPVRVYPHPTYSPL